MRKRFITVMFVCLVAGTVAQAQVNIGSLNNPHPGAILDISQSGYELGFLLPRVELDDVSVFQLQALSDDGTVKAAKGMLVYNTSKTTKGGGGFVGEFVWDGSKWLPVGGATSTMTLTTVGDSALTRETALCAAGGYDVHAVIDDPDCDNSGDYQFIVLSGEAHITPVSSPTKEFDLQFSPNPLGQMRQAVVQVINPCGKTGTWVFYQQGADCGEHVYTASNITFMGNDQTYCTQGAVYAEVTEIKEVEDNGVICGSNPVYLQVLNVQPDDMVLWFKNGVHQSQFDYGQTGYLSQNKRITLSDPDTDLGTWYAVIQTRINPGVE
ncbi:MAG: hypothetical protein LBR66_01325, partial [Candidatus Symbiothrix sp.]|nr:hypothetical protein [Candidatus Symbiothrix sp.]